MREWDVVTNTKPLAPSEADHGRIIPVLDDLMRLPMSVKASLYLYEVIALVLYTGPMVSAIP